MQNPVKKPSVTIFAGSSTPQDAAIMAAAVVLGTKLAQAGYDIVYGGGTQGVMGAVAAAALAAGAHVTAVVLAKYAHEEQLPGASLIFVETEQERFSAMTGPSNPAAFFALPGGPGTMREALQGLELAVYDGGPPVILVQVGNYLDGLKAAFDSALAGGLIKPRYADKMKLWSPDLPLEAALPKTGVSEGPASISKAGAAYTPRP